MLYHIISMILSNLISSLLLGKIALKCMFCRISRTSDTNGSSSAGIVFSWEVRRERIVEKWPLFLVLIVNVSTAGSDIWFSLIFGDKRSEIIFGVWISSPFTINVNVFS